MPNDAEIQKILVDGFNRISTGLEDLKDAVKDHDTRLRSAELTIARALGALGLLGFILGLTGAIWAVIHRP